jgi:TRAP-type C4-dicarboxylate transport system permease small subunit
VTGGRAPRRRGLPARLHACLEAVNAAIDSAAARLVAGAVGVMFVVVVAQVFYRYVLNAPLVWAEEAARYLLVFTTFAGASVAMRRGAHIAVTLIVVALPPGVRRAVETAAQIASCSVYGVLIWYGSALAAQNFDQLSPAMHLPLGAVYLMIPLAGIVLVLQAIQRILHLATVADTVTPPVGVSGA